MNVLSLQEFFTITYGPVFEVIYPFAILLAILLGFMTVLARILRQSQRVGKG